MVWLVSPDSQEREKGEICVAEGRLENVDGGDGRRDEGEVVGGGRSLLTMGQLGEGGVTERTKPRQNCGGEKLKDDGIIIFCFSPFWPHLHEMLQITHT